MPKITPFVGGPLDGQTTTGRGVYRSAETGEHVQTDTGDRWFITSQFRKSTPQMYERLRRLYVRRGDEYLWAFDVKRRMLTESRARLGLPAIEENDWVRVTRADGSEAAGVVVDVHLDNVYVRADRKAPEVKIHWPDVIAHEIRPVYAGALA